MTNLTQICIPLSVSISIIRHASLFSQLFRQCFKILWSCLICEVGENLCVIEIIWIVLRRCRIWVLSLIFSFLKSICSTDISHAETVKAIVIEFARKPLNLRREVNNFLSKSRNVVWINVRFCDSGFFVYVYFVFFEVLSVFSNNFPTHFPVSIVFF